MAVLRTEVPVGYKTTIVRTIVQGIRAVFTDQYPETDFANLNIVNEFPLTEVEYPAIVVRFNERQIPNAGVGHREYFNDPDGRLREWYHRRYEGQLEFTICALTPLDRDVLSNALVEMLSFGALDELLNQFLIKVYGDIGVDVGVVGLLHQISLNTDIIMALGESNQIAPWQPEDTMVYQNAYSIQCNGGFYNSLRSTAALGFIEVVKSYPYIDVDVPFDNDPGDQWSMTFNYDDFGFVGGNAVISADEEKLTVDAGEVVGKAVISTASEAQVHTARFVANRGTAFSSTLAAGISISTTGAVASGGKLMLSVVFNNVLSATTATASGGGLTWNRIVKVQSSDNVGILCIFEADAPSGVPQGTNITITPDQQITRIVASLEEWENCAIGTPAAGHIATLTGNNQNPSAGPTSDSANLSDGLYAAWTFNNETLTQAHWTAGSGFTVDYVHDSGGASPVGLATEYQSAISSTGTKSASMTTTDSGEPWAGAVIILAHA